MDVIEYIIRKQDCRGHGGAIVSMITSQQKGSGFKPGAFLCGVCMICPVPERFSKDK